jgi:hypothetical protein
MSTSWNIGVSASQPGNVLSATVQETGDATAEILNLNVPCSTANQNANVAFPFSNTKLKALEMLATGANLLVKTNSNSAPNDTITLIDGSPLIWWTSAYYTSLITADVTRLHLTNACTTANVTFNLRALYTP